MTKFKIVRGDEVPEDQLLTFFTEAYHPRTDKIQFLQDHHVWFYKHRKHILLAIAENGDLAGMSVAIPMKLALMDEVVDGVWWLDLIVLPEYRRQGIQGLMNDFVTTSFKAILAFPNDDSTRLLRKTGFHDRIQGHIMARILNPAAAKSSRWGGLAGALVRAKIMLIDAPLAAGLRARIMRFKPQNVTLLDNPQPEPLAALFEQHFHGGYITSCRDADYVRWRYFKLPHFDELQFFVSADKLVMILRHMPTPQGIETQILDMWGDLDDMDALMNAVKCALRNAAEHKAHTVTILATLPHLEKLLRQHGFSPKIERRLTWYAATSQVFQTLDDAPHYWTISDIR